MIGEDGRIKIRGFELVRRDWSQVAKPSAWFLRQFSRKAARKKAVKIVREAVERLKSGKVPLEELAITTQLNKAPGKYEVTSPELAAAEKAAKRGVPIEKGSVIQYVIVKTGKTTKASSAPISERAEPVDFVKEGDYDADYYINNQVLPSVMKILKELGYSEYDLKIGGKQKSLLSLNSILNHICNSDLRFLVLHRWFSIDRDEKTFLSRYYIYTGCYIDNKIRTKNSRRREKETRRNRIRSVKNKRTYYACG